MGLLPLSSFPIIGTGAASRTAPPVPKDDSTFVVGRTAVQADPWVFKVAEHQREREAAFRLVHQVYLRAGLSSDHLSGMRVMRHHLSDHTDVLIAKRASQVAFTTTLVRDAEYGLPLESLFAPEVTSMRAEGRRVAEISCLTSDASLENKSQRFELLVNMISLTLQAARRRGVDRVLLAVHPRHARVYQRLFGCERCSEIKEYAAVRGNPAVLCMHDFAQLDQTRYPMYERIYSPSYAPWQLDGARMTEAEKRYFHQALASNVPDVIPVAA